jgi:N6-L-threonylcarbamoyladenine synthase
MLILAIESSCDETAVAVVRLEDNTPKVLSNVVFSQIDTHKEFGGVIPEVAARLHTQKIIPTLKEGIQQAGVDMSELDGIAVSVGPGLSTALLVGIETAKTLAHILDLPLFPVNHIYGHVLSSLFDKKLDTINYPALSLVVSGGHTEISLLTDQNSIEIIGRTSDDAVGEAFDKVAKMVGLGYPGGPAVSKAALETDESYEFPRPMKHTEDFDFSFSGIKTSVRYKVRELEEQGKLGAEDIAKIAHGFQDAALDVLTHKVKRAISRYNIQTLLIGGGVSANKQLRDALDIMKSKLNIAIHYPELKYCGDNAAMIGLVPLITQQKAYNKTNMHTLNPKPHWKVDQTYDEIHNA